MKNSRVLILGFILLLLSGHTYAQKAGIGKFIPKGYQILDSASGNLNLDDKPDMILVLNMAGEDTMYNEAPKRPVIILTGNAKGGYVIASKNENAINTHDIGMFDTFSEIKVIPGSFSIHHMGGFGHNKFSLIHTFKYDPASKKWMLDKFEEYDIHIDFIEETDSMNVHETADIKTSGELDKISFEDFNLLK